MAELRFYDQESSLPLRILGSSPIAHQFFTDWCVTCERQDITSLHLKSKAGTIPLQALEADYTPTVQQKQWVPPNDSSKPGWDFPFTSAGWLTIYGITDSGMEVPLQPALKVLPASLTDDEFKMIVGRLQNLAEFPHAVCSVRVSAASGVNEELTAAVSRVLTFYASVRKNWQNVVHRPWKDIKPIASVVHLESQAVHRRQRVVSDAEHRNRLHVVCHVPTEHLNNDENRFLAAVLRLLQKSIAALVCRIDSEISRLEDALLDIPTAKQLQIPLSRARQFDETFSAHRSRLQSGLAELRAASARLREAETWVCNALCHPIVKMLASAAPIGAESFRVANSITYGPIYRARRHFLQAAPSANDNPVLRRLREQRVGRTWELYELWVFLELYNTLIDEFGFRPDPGTPSPADLLAMHRDDLVLPPDKSFALRFRPTNVSAGDEDVVLNLRYNPTVISQWGTPLCPDILIEVSWKGVQSRFVVDAKYRRYASMTGRFRRRSSSTGAETPFEDDLCMTARRKYYEGLRCDSAFIAHSDPDPAYTFWGASRQFSSNLARPCPKLPDERPDHAFGAIFISPVKRGMANLRKLLECVLMYHVGIENICWTCGRRITPRMVKDWVGKYFCCEGHRFWIISHCQGEEHRLVKLGRESFHNVSPDNVWDCECPKCGNSLKNPRIPITVVGHTYGPHTRVFGLHYEIGGRERFRNDERNRGTFYLTLPSDFNEMNENERTRILEVELLKKGANINYVHRTKRLSDDLESAIGKQSEH